MMPRRRRSAVETYKPKRITEAESRALIRAAVDEAGRTRDDRDPHAPACWYGGIR